MPSIPPITTLTRKEIDWLYLHKCKRHGSRYITHYSCLHGDTNSKEKIGVLDIETTGFKSDWDITLSYAILELGTKNIFGRVLTKEEITNKDEDKKLIKECILDMRKFDRLVTFYGSMFDLPFLRGRAEMYGLKNFPVFGEISGTDLYWTVKNRFKFSRKSLGVTCKNLGIAAKGHQMYPEQWKGARRGDFKALNFVWTHNKEDVVSTGALYERVSKYARKTNTSI